MKKIILILVGIILFSFSGLASNLGEECDGSSDCSTGSCLSCPSDTKFEICTNEDWMAIGACKYGKERYGDKFYCPPKDKLNIITRQGGKKGYCGRVQVKYGTKCLGNWNEDYYFIDFNFLRNVGDEVLSLNKFLTQDVLDIWKEEVLKMISKDYFKKFDVENIQGQLIDTNEFYAYINYNFKFDWIEIEQPGQGSTWTRIKVAEKREGIWEILTKEEMILSHMAELERWHDLGLIRAFEYEIDSVISEEEALISLRKCNKDLAIEKILIDSKDKKLIFTALGEINLDTEKCTDPHNTFIHVIGVVDLQTGEVECKEEVSACALFSAKASEPSQIIYKEEVGFFKRLINWFKNLFS